MNTTTVSEASNDIQRAEGEGMGTARATQRPRATLSLVARVRNGIKNHPYRSLLVATAVGAGVGLALSTRVTRAITLRAGTFAISELIEKYLKAAIAGS